MKDKAEEILDKYFNYNEFDRKRVIEIMLEFGRLTCEEQREFILNNCKLTGDWGHEVKGVLGIEKVKNCKNICDL